MSCIVCPCTRIIFDQVWKCIPGQIYTFCRLSQSYSLQQQDLQQAPPLLLLTTWQNQHWRHWAAQSHWPRTRKLMSAWTTVFPVTIMLTRNIIWSRPRDKSVQVSVGPTIRSQHAQTSSPARSIGMWMIQWRCINVPHLGTKSGFYFNIPSECEPEHAPVSGLSHSVSVYQNTPCVK